MLMQAMQLQAYGGPDALRLVEIDAPTAGAGQLSVRVRCASVNPVDWKRASGSLRFIMPVHFPAVPTYDIAGEVAALGLGLSGFEVGQRVHARIAQPSAGGAAQYAVVDAKVVATIPDDMDFADAAALPLAGMTALQALRDVASMAMANARERVLVIGASGGVGHFGVQIAKAAGAYVTGVCSTRNIEMVRGLGAHAVIDYTQANCYAGVAPFDVVLDCIGAAPGACAQVMTPRARYVSVIPGPSTFLWPMLHPFSNQRVRACMLKASSADLEQLDGMWRRGVLKAVIDSRFPLAQLGAAWQRSMSGRAVGKIVIDVS